MRVRHANAENGQYTIGILFKYHLYLCSGDDMAQDAIFILINGNQTVQLRVERLCNFNSKGLNFLYPW